MNCSKTPYPDKKSALTMRNARLRSHCGRPKDLRIYYCEECVAWHLSSTFYRGQAKDGRFYKQGRRPELRRF